MSSMGSMINVNEHVIEELQAFLAEKGWAELFSEQEWQEICQLTEALHFEPEIQSAYWSSLLISWDARSLTPHRSVYEELKAILRYYLQLLHLYYNFEPQATDVLLLRLAETQVDLQHKQLLFWRFEHEQKKQRVSNLHLENERAQAEFYNLSELTQFIGQDLKEQSKLVRDALDGVMGVLDASWIGLYLYDDSSGKQGTLYSMLHEDFQIERDYSFPHSDFWNPLWKASLNQAQLQDIFEPLDELECFFPNTHNIMTQTLQLPNSGRGLLIACSEDFSAFSGFRQFFSIFGTQLSTALHNAHLHAQINEMAIRDALTGLFNRRHFEERYKLAYDLSRRYSRELSVLMLDIDHFKQINDNYGHQVGDEVLRLMGSILKQRLRSTDLLGRYGGEEFIAVLQETGPEGAEIAAQDLVDIVSEQAIDIGQNEALKITVSIGFASFPVHALQMEKLIKLADDGLYQAKRNGRNQIGCTEDTISVIQ